MGLMILEASCGSLLEIQVEGVDDAAKSFCDELKKGLNEQDYLRERFYLPFKAHLRAVSGDDGLRSLYKRDYKE
jgi:hypothetical protein